MTTGRSLQGGVVLHRLQDLEAVHLGHLQIQQNQPRGAGQSVLKRAPLVQVVQRLGAIAHDDDVVGEPVFAERRQRQFGIVRVVLGQKNRADGGHHEARPFGSET